MFHIEAQRWKHYRTVFFALKFEGEHFHFMVLNRFAWKQNKRRTLIMNWGKHNKKFSFNLAMSSLQAKNFQFDRRFSTILNR